MHEERKKVYSFNINLDILNVFVLLLYVISYMTQLKATDDEHTHVSVRMHLAESRMSHTLM